MTKRTLKLLVLAVALALLAAFCGGWKWRVAVHPKNFGTTHVAASISPDGWTWDSATGGGGSQFTPYGWTWD
jgi:hypothetical protein